MSILYTVESPRSAKDRMFMDCSNSKILLLHFVLSRITYNVILCTKLHIRYAPNSLLSASSLVTNRFIKAVASKLDIEVPYNFKGSVEGYKDLIEHPVLVFYCL